MEKIWRKTSRYVQLQSMGDKRLDVKYKGGNVSIRTSPTRSTATIKGDKTKVKQNSRVSEPERRRQFRRG